MMVTDGESLRSVVVDQPSRYRYGLIGRVVEHLDVELIERVVEAADGLKQPLDYELFVEDRKLDSDAGQF